MRALPVYIVVLMVLAIGEPTLRGAPVDEGTAGLLASNWIARSTIFQASGESFSVASVTPLSNGPRVTVWHVHLAPRGYILIGADRRLTPVLGCSTESDLNLSSASDNTLGLILERECAYAARRLEALDLADAPAKTEDWILRNETAWDSWLTAPLARDYTPTNVVVPPMLATTWGQSRHYNYLLPEDPYSDPYGYYDDKVPAGCVAASGATLMKHYAWPPYGQGAVSYTDSVGVVTGTYYAGWHRAMPRGTNDLPGGFDYANMNTHYDAYTTYNTTQVQAVSALYKSAAYAAKSDFGSYAEGGTAASSSDMTDALATHFFYERAVGSYMGTNVESFTENLRHAMLNGQPTMCSITGTYSHSVIMDGLSSDGGSNYFHVNYGWNGQNNGWYTPQGLVDTTMVHRGYFGARPAFQGLLTNRPTAFAPMAGNSYTSYWAFPSCYSTQVQGFRLRQAGAMATNFLDDDANRFGEYTTGGDSSPWAPRSGYYWVSNNNVSGSTAWLATPSFMATSNSGMAFDYKAQLYQDHFYVEISTNGGDDWEERLHETDYSRGYTNGWWPHSWNLSSYAGQECQVRFRYAGGGRWSGDYGVGVDRIHISNVDLIVWTTRVDSIPPTQYQSVVDNLATGRCWLTVEAFDGTTWGAPSPLTRLMITNVLGGSMDTDGDQLPDWWETLHYGSPTGATASADTDGDGQTALEEYWTGCIPTNAASYFNMSYRQTSGWDRFSWSTNGGCRYTIVGYNYGPNGITSATSLHQTTDGHWDTHITGSGYYRIQAAFTNEL